MNEKLESVDDFELGGVYVVPAIDRLGSKAWVVSHLDNGGFGYMKRSGSSGGMLSWDEKHPLSERTIRELVEDGEIYKVDVDEEVRQDALDAARSEKIER